MTDQTGGFQPFPKIPRWFRDIIITEKLDGTNACVVVEQSQKLAVPGDWHGDSDTIKIFDHEGEPWRVKAQSRTRYIIPGRDNFGFARWVHDNAEALALLGPGRHFGEWWGNGIQRGYGLPQGDRRFSLFNVGRWAAVSGAVEGQALVPDVPGLGVVPTLYRGPARLPGGEDAVREALRRLQFAGSQAAPFMNPEGVIVFHAAGGHLFKATLDNDQAKGSQ